MVAEDTLGKRGTGIIVGKDIPMPKAAGRILPAAITGTEVTGIDPPDRGSDLQITCRPNGISESSTSLRCCRAKGIPMMVIERRKANTRCTSAVYRPPQSSQMILQKR